ncbi:hypothetical protein JHK82_043332 [Glycine max]|nr:hypothetical protein JHK82_043332 [Glycine max]
MLLSSAARPLVYVAAGCNEFLFGMQRMRAATRYEETKRRPLTIKLTAKAILAAAATDSAVAIGILLFLWLLSS